MSTEQLKMLLDVLAPVGASGKEALIWYLAVTYLVPLFGWLVTFAGLLWAGKHVACMLLSLSEARKICETIRDTLRIGSPGFLSPRELREVRSKVDAWLAQKNGPLTPG